MTKSLNLRARLLVGATLLLMPATALANDMVADAGEAGVGVARSQIAGRVSDSSGAALPGARVSVRETGSVATTDLQGEFILSVPTDAPVTLDISYLGRPDFSQTVTPGDGRVAMQFVLPTAQEARNSDDIVVTGASILDNTARALNQQRQADNTVNVISADAIGRFPDPNVAEALQRVAGIGIERDQGEGRYINVRGAPADFSSVSIDGVSVAAVDPTTRAVDLDTIPSDVVSNLEVTKTLLPNQDADSISGQVNISTRSPFDARGFRFNASAGMSHNQMGGNDRRGSAFVSTLFGEEKTFGVLLSGSYSKTDRKLDNVENAWGVINRPPAAGGGTILGVTETLFKDYDTKRERISATGALEWRPEPGTRVYLRGTFSRFEDNEFRNRLSILWTEGTLQPGSTDSSATYANTRIEKQVRHRIQVNEIYTAVGGFETRLGEGTWSGNIAYTKSKQTYPRRDELLFRSSLRPRQSYDFSVDPNEPAYSLFTTNEHLQEGSYAFRENAFRSNDTLNDEYSFATKIELPVDLGGLPVTFTMGGRYRDRSIAADEERLRDRTAAGAPAGTLGSFLSSIESRNYGYFLGHKFTPSAADAYFDATKGTSMRRIPQSITADYQASEKILGMFGMAKIDLGDTNLILGVRTEATDFEGEAPTFNETTSVIGSVRSKSTYFNWFPNLTVRHAFTPDLIGRVALSRGINRPNFLELVPRVVENTDSETVRVTAGNPALRPTLSNNIDAGLEYYIRPLGIVSVSAFYKDLEDYRYTVTRSGTYLGQPALLTRPENAPDGKLYGFEVNWQMQFNFLPGLLSGFGVFANYTRTEADIRLSSPYAGRSRFPLPGQSKNTYNASLFYEKGPFNARVSYTKRSDYLDEINADNGALDLYWQGRGQVDVTGSYQVLENVGLFFEGKNLTNSAGKRYFGIRERTYEYERFGYTLFGGVRVKF